MILKRKLITWQNCHEFLLNSRVKAELNNDFYDLARAIRTGDTESRRSIGLDILKNLTESDLLVIEKIIGQLIKVVSPNNKTVINISDNINELDSHLNKLPIGFWLLNLHIDAETTSVTAIRT